MTETQDNRYQYIATYARSLYLTLISLDQRLGRFDGLIPSGRQQSVWPKTRANKARSYLISASPASVDGLRTSASAVSVFESLRRWRTGQRCFLSPPSTPSLLRDAGKTRSISLEYARGFLFFCHFYSYKLVMCDHLRCLCICNVLKHVQGSASASSASAGSDAQHPCVADVDQQ